jgi:Peroxisomal biogenesis factor 11 (PEX11)
VIRLAYVSRKALRLGKWLGNVEKINSLHLSGPYDVLQLIAYGGEGVYYFIDQFIWCRPCSVHADWSNGLASLADACAQLWPLVWHQAMCYSVTVTALQ